MRRYTVSIDDRSFVIDVLETAADRFEVTVDGQTFEATLHADHDLPGSVISPEIPTSEARSARPAPGTSRPMGSPRPTPSTAQLRPGTGSAIGGPETLSAPMPGVVLEVVVAAGARVKRGDPILVLEAMKMRNTIRSPHDAVVLDVAVAAGQLVGPGDPLVRLDPSG